MFYGTSRSGAGKWCSMRLCGNRAKQEAWRGRRRTTDSRRGCETRMLVARPPSCRDNAGRR
ncbi:hypothetical protein GVV04_28150 [Micromonospora sp. NEAU-HG-1]|nr:hypothetical protein [Micromonospora rubida]